MENQVRVCNNESFVVGRLKEKKIKLTKSPEGKDGISGYLVIVTDTKYGKGEVRISLMQSALTKDNKENSLYKGLVTVMNEYKSSVETGSIETADLIKIQGSLSDETYYNVKKGDFVEKVGTKGTFVNRIDRISKSGEVVEDKVNVCLEGYIANIKQVGEELEVKFITIGYGGVAIPVIGYVPKELVIPFQSRHQVGQTTTLYIAIVNSVEVTQVQTEVGFGEELGEKIEKVIVKNVIFGGGAINYNNPYTQEQIQQALALREVKLQEKKVKAIEKESQASTNMTVGFGQPGGGQFGGAAAGQGMGMGMQNPGFNMPNGGFNMPSGSFGS